MSCSKNVQVDLVASSGTNLPSNISIHTNKLPNLIECVHKVNPKGLKHFLGIK